MSDTHTLIVKTNIQSTVYYNDKLNQLITNFIEEYNSTVNLLNQTINDTKSLIDEKNLTECKDMIEFMGTEKNTLNLEDLKKLISNDYILISTTNNTYIKSKKSFINHPKSLIEHNTEASSLMNKYLERLNLSPFKTNNDGVNMYKGYIKTNNDGVNIYRGDIKSNPDSIKCRSPVPLRPSRFKNLVVTDEFIPNETEKINDYVTNNNEVFETPTNLNDVTDQDLNDVTDQIEKDIDSINKLLDGYDMIETSESNVQTF
jgi:hypothetical protein